MKNEGIVHTCVLRPRLDASEQEIGHYTLREVGNYSRAARNDCASLQLSPPFAIRSCLFLAHVFANMSLLPTT